MEKIKLKRTYIGLVALLLVVGGGAVAALHGTTKSDKALHAVAKDDKTIDVSNIPTTGQAIPQQASAAPSGSATPVEASSDPSAPTADTPKTVDQLKAEAKDKIVADGYSVEQDQCFDPIIDRLYGWNITEAEMLKRIGEIEQTYASFCSAQQVVFKSNTAFPVGTPGAPPAFRD